MTLFYKYSLLAAYKILSVTVSGIERFDLPPHQRAEAMDLRNRINSDTARIKSRYRTS